MSVSSTDSQFVSSGIAALDRILGGGYSANRVCLIEGTPGTGKTTLALQFLLDGVRNGQRVLHITLSETGGELATVADSHGWSLDGVDVFELSPPELRPERDTRYTMYEPAEVELIETTRAVLAKVEEVRPCRVVFDSLSEILLLAQSPLRYRRQVLALKQYFAGKRCTVLLLNDRGPADNESPHLHSICNGVVQLEQRWPKFGGARRRLRVVKVRGVEFLEGYHDFVIRKGGLDVFPRLTARESAGRRHDGLMRSGVPGLDSLFDGGLRHGKSVLILGPAGVGKSSLAVQYAVQAARGGGHAAVFTFDESVGTLVERSAGLGMDVRPHVTSGRVLLEDIDPAEMPPGEFIQLVRRTVEGWGEAAEDKVVVIDSLNGMLYAMPGERALILQLHELLAFMSRRGVITFLVMAQHGFTGRALATPIDTSYIADTVVLLRYVETAGGEYRQAITVMKRRIGRHDRAIREFRMSGDGLAVGRHLTGVPQPTGGGAPRGPGEGDHGGE